MQSSHILVTTNNFWVGGRETYAATYLGALAAQGVTADLLCSSIQPGLAEADAFRTVSVAHGNAEGDQLRSWLDLGGRLVAERRPTLLWAQHFALLPAWLLAQQHELPLLVTFHGPLCGAGRPNDPMEALGMVLGIHRGSLLSGVSREVCANLERLTGRAAALLPNVVTLGDRTFEPPRWPPRRWLIVTRAEKLGHLRAALRLFAAYRQQARGARLVVVSSATPAKSHTSRGFMARMRQGVDTLGYRWCRSEGVSLWRALAATHWAGYSAEPRAHMREADLVLGMGRVVLEGLAEGRPALLVGYDELHGLVDDARWEELSRSNFSGRGVPPRDTARCVGDLIAPRSSALPPPARFAPADAAARLLGLASGDIKPEPAREHRDLADRLCGMLRDGADMATVFQEVAVRLTEQEWGSFFRLSRG